jgi:hypothetical protein
MHLKINPQTKILSLITIVVLVFSPLFMAQASTTQTQTSTLPTAQLITTSEYTNYVHNFVNAEGNCTYMEKPMFPVLFNSGQIPIGENWTIICPLQAGHNYHIYFYGAWIDTSPQATTDYNIFVYDPQGNLESSHIESAGFPPHLGTTVNDALFTPTQSGNYSFVIINNPFGSKGAQQATFMIIENLACDTWYTSYVEGTSNSNPVFYTNWAYEFETNASHVQLYIKVPDTLGMYETRLYLMNNAKSPSLNNFPLAWEPGLYGNLSSPVGGYNFEPNDYRGVAYTTDEHMGQFLTLNYTSPNTGDNLYQLVLIGNVGSGNVQLMLKDNFEKDSLIPSAIRVFPDTPTTLTYTSNNTNLETAQLAYTTNSWTNTTTLNMNISNQTCNATIPGQPAGTIVQYQINATDILENGLFASGNYTVENASLIPLATIPSKVYPDTPTKLTYTSNGTKLETAQLAYTLDNWTNTISVNMDISNQTCNATIPGQPAGTIVQYQINATDILENGLFASGNYTVKEPLTLKITPVKTKIRLGENITINGILTPNYNDFKATSNSNDSTTTTNSKDSKVTSNSNDSSNESNAAPNYNDYNDSIGEVQFSNIDSTQTIDCVVSSNGTFVATFRPDASGIWAVTATCPETQTSYSCYSQQLMITVTPQPVYVKYSLFIIAGFIAAMAVGGVVYFLKFRNK